MRVRLIHPGLFVNPELAKLSVLHRYLFENLPVIADKEGRLEDEPERILVQLFPYDGRRIKVEELLGTLAEHGFIRRYVAEGQPVICIPNFLKYQHPHYNEKKSVLPACDPDTDGKCHGISCNFRECPSVNSKRYTVINNGDQYGDQAKKRAMKGGNSRRRSSQILASTPRAIRLSGRYGDKVQR